MKQKIIKMNSEALLLGGGLGLVLKVERDGDFLKLTIVRQENLPC